MVLEPCPFCNSSELELRPDENGIGSSYSSGSDICFVHCDGCGAEGPQAFYKDEAIASWNRVRPRHERDCLAEAIIAMNKKLQIYNTNDLTGPQLMLLCDDVSDYVIHLQQEIKNYA